MAEDIFWSNYANRFTAGERLISSLPSSDLQAVITIPAMAEPDIIKTLDSLAHNSFNEIVEVIILLNAHDEMSEEDANTHHTSWEACLRWSEQNSNSLLQCIPVWLPPSADKKWGVGKARKAAMDEAARRLGENGIIICLDADCTVASNYIDEILSQFRKHPQHDACSIYFEHPVDDLQEPEKSHIIEYELHLRYLVAAQGWCGHPFAFHTVGSAMAVRRNAYLLQGGMNTRQAGEDFYFLQKFIETGRFFEINGTSVYPSSRQSRRVPFGTGRSMMERIEQKDCQWTTDFAVFQLIKPLFCQLDLIWEELERGVPCNNLLKRLHLDERILDYLHSIDLPQAMYSIYLHTSTRESFIKRFFRYFNAFRFIRLRHDLRDQYFPDVEVMTAVHTFLLETEGASRMGSASEALSCFRQKQKADLPDYLKISV